MKDISFPTFTQRFFIDSVFVCFCFFTFYVGLDIDIEDLFNVEYDKHQT